MGADKESLIDNMHQIVYEVLKTSLEEGRCRILHGN